jgi:hypothetical protein
LPVSCDQVGEVEVHVTFAGATLRDLVLRSRCATARTVRVV